MGFRLLSAEDIEKALEGVTRQYLAGQLAKPQKLQHIVTPELEIGITAYTDPTDEIPHWHQVASEHQLMLSGETTYRNSITLEEHRFVTGDFYFIETGTCYSQRSPGGTRILFVKVPSVNDKTVCRNCKRECPSRLEPFTEDLVFQVPNDG